MRPSLSSKQISFSWLTCVSHLPGLGLSLVPVWHTAGEQAPYFLRPKSRVPPHQGCLQYGLWPPPGWFCYPHLAGSVVPTWSALWPPLGWPSFFLLPQHPAFLSVQDSDFHLNGNKPKHSASLPCLPLLAELLSALSGSAGSPLGASFLGAHGVSMSQPLEGCASQAGVCARSSRQSPHGPRRRCWFITGLS